MADLTPADLDKTPVGLTAVFSGPGAGKASASNPWGVISQWTPSTAIRSPRGDRAGALGRSGAMGRSLIRALPRESSLVLAEREFPAKQVTAGFVDSRPQRVVPGPRSDRTLGWAGRVPDLTALP